MSLVIPEEVVTELRLQHWGTTTVVYADERREARPLTDVTIEIGNLATRTEAIVGAPGSPVLIGQLVLEALDLIADCRNRTLEPRPPEGRVLALRGENWRAPRTLRSHCNMLAHEAEALRDLGLPKLAKVQVVYSDDDGKEQDAGDYRVPKAVLEQYHAHVNGPSLLFAVEAKVGRISVVMRITRTADDQTVNTIKRLDVPFAVTSDDPGYKVGVRVIRDAHARITPEKLAEYLTDMGYSPGEDVDDIENHARLTVCREDTMDASLDVLRGDDYRRKTLLAEAVRRYFPSQGPQDHRSGSLRRRVRPPDDRGRVPCGLTSARTTSHVEQRRRPPSPTPPPHAPNACVRTLSATVRPTTTGQHRYRRTCLPVHEPANRLGHRLGRDARARSDQGVRIAEPTQFHRLGSDRLVRGGSATWRRSATIGVGAMVRTLSCRVGVPDGLACPTLYPHYSFWTTPARARLPMR